MPVYVAVVAVVAGVVIGIFFVGLFHVFWLKGYLERLTDFKASERESYIRDKVNAAFGVDLARAHREGLSRGYVEAIHICVSVDRDMDDVGARMALKAVVKELNARLIDSDFDDAQGSLS